MKKVSLTDSRGETSPLGLLISGIVLVAIGLFEVVFYEPANPLVVKANPHIAIIVRLVIIFGIICVISAAVTFFKKVESVKTKKEIELAGELWYVIDRGEIYGPYDYIELEKLKNEGKIKENVKIVKASK